MRNEDYGYGSGSGSVLLSFLLGGVVGAGLAFLFAPRQGSETRTKIKDYVDDIRGRSTGYIEQTKDKMSSVIEKGKSTYEEKKSLVGSAIGAGKEAYEKEKEKLSKEHNA